jgi:hypothetical protein
MGGTCLWALAVLGCLYLGALALFAVGTFGLFGSPQGPLAGVFLVPLGLPWNLLLEGASEGARPWLAALAPLVNLLVLLGLCRLNAARRGS